MGCDGRLRGSPTAGKRQEGLFAGRRRLLLSEPRAPQGDSYELAWANDCVTVTAATCRRHNWGTAGNREPGGRRQDAGPVPADSASRPASTSTRCSSRPRPAMSTGRTSARIGRSPVIAMPSSKHSSSRSSRGTSTRCASTRATIRSSGSSTTRVWNTPATNQLTCAGETSRPSRGSTRPPSATACGPSCTHYVSHFTQALADHLPTGDLREGHPPGGVRPPRHRGVQPLHLSTQPSRRSLPSTASYMNFESSGDAIPFMRKTLLAVANNLPRKPVLFFRLWGVTDVEGMKGLLGDYSGAQGAHPQVARHERRVLLPGRGRPGEGVEEGHARRRVHLQRGTLPQLRNQHQRKTLDRPGLRPCASGEHPGQGR